jgi:uncharacterized protein
MKILITGASEGIGLEIAKILASKGNEITLLARHKLKLKEAVASLNGNGHQIIEADLSEPTSLALMKEIIANKNYDVLINNAGFGMYGRFTEMPFPEQEKMMRLNIEALTSLSYYYLSNAKKGDALVNVASVLGSTSYPGAAVYAATKAYVISFSESLWWEYKNKGIFVMGFCPGSTYTNFHKVAGGDSTSFPKFIMQTPQQVAKELVAALTKRKKPKVVSGNINRSMLFFQKFMGRKSVANMMGGFGPLN